MIDIGKKIIVWNTSGKKFDFYKVRIIESELSLLFKKRTIFSLIFAIYTLPNSDRGKLSMLGDACETQGWKKISQFFICQPVVASANKMNPQLDFLLFFRCIWAPYSYTTYSCMQVFENLCATQKVTIVK
jgi:hypothetical protein